MSGATAGTYAGSTNDFARQVTRWLGTAPKFVARDLTVVYFGYNDIKLSLDPDGADLAGAKVDYRAQLDRIIKAGAAGGSRRIFLVMPHDWGRSPRYVGSAIGPTSCAQRTEVWNALPGGARARRSPTPASSALDLFTAMECVFNQPGDFGFTNVTSARPQGADPAKYLFDLNDDIHFGQRGQMPDPPGRPVLPDPGLGLVQHRQGPGDGAAEAGRGPRGRQGVRRHLLRPALDRPRRGELTGIAAWRDAVVGAKSSWEALVYRLHAIKYGELNARKRSDLFVGGDPHDGRIDMDYYVWVAIGADRTCVIDTGFGAEVAERRGRRLLRSPLEGLAALGVDANKVQDVVITHLHFDHAGNMGLFPNARLHLQDREMDFVTGRQMTHAFMRAAYEVEDVVYMVRAVHAERVVFHDGDAVIAPGIEVHRIGGHTRGLQAVRIATERGNVVLASDTSHYFENFEQGRVFSIVDSAAAVLEGYRRLRELAARPELIVPGHDPLVMRRYPPSDASLGGVAVRLDVDPITPPA